MRVGKTWQLLLEAARALKVHRRGLLLTAIAALICLLLADLFGASEDAKTLAAVFGALAGKSLDILDDRFKLGERWLAVIGAVLGLIMLRGARRWLIARVRSVGATTARPHRSGPTAIATTARPLRSAPTAIATVAAAGSMVIGLVAFAGALFASPDDERRAGARGREPRVFSTPAEAIAAQLSLSTVQYVGRCDGSRMEPPRRGRPSDRRVCSVRMRAQEGGYLFGYVSAGGRTRSPMAKPGSGTELAILREDKRGWKLVRCLVYCAYYGREPAPP